MLNKTSGRRPRNRSPTNLPKPVLGQDWSNDEEVADDTTSVPKIEILEEKPLPADYIPRHPAMLALMGPVQVNEQGDIVDDLGSETSEVPPQNVKADENGNILVNASPECTNSNHLNSCFRCDRCGYSNCLFQCKQVWQSNNCSTSCRSSKIYMCDFVARATNCSHCSHSDNISGCRHLDQCHYCVDCSNLRNATFCVRNKQSDRLTVLRILASRKVKLSKADFDFLAANPVQAPREPKAGSKMQAPKPKAKPEISIPSGLPGTGKPARGASKARVIKVPTAAHQ